MNTRTLPRRIRLLFLSVWMRGIHFLYTRCIKPHATNEDDSRREFMVNTILTCSVCMLIALWIFVISSTLSKGPAYRGISIYMFSSIVCVFMFLLYLSRKGYSRATAYILVSIYFICTSYGLYRWGFSLPFVITGYIVTIITASILISTRYGFIITSSIAAIMLIFTQLHINGSIPLETYWRHEPYKLKDPIQTAFIFMVIMAISWLSNREIERSLVRARRSEQALLKERDLLEITVEERTRELKYAQQEKMNHLYRFAEFGRLSSGIFHDLMTPLTAVIANVSQLTSNPEHLPEVKNYLVKAVHASKRMGAFLETIRKQLNTRHTYQLFSLNQELNEVVDILHYRAREARVDLVVNVSEPLALYGNPITFHHIALNCIANAIDASAHTLSRNTEHPIVTISLNKKESHATLTITDSGCGIAPAILEKIFDPFFTTKHHSGGMGLGLSSSKYTIEKEFGGTITISSIERSGTTVTISIPLHNESSPSLSTSD